MRVLVTCPPMLVSIDAFRAAFEERGIALTCPPVVQTLSEDELLRLVPEHDGWIIGDDPATAAVFRAGADGRLRAAVKWGVGVDNVDFDGARAAGVRVVNTPGMFGREVADVAMCYVTALARELVAIDRGVRSGGWPKPCGISLYQKIAAVVGYGDIGRELAQRLLAAGMRVRVYDPQQTVSDARIEQGLWPDGVEDADFLIFCCALTASSRHMFDHRLLPRLKRNVRVVNVSRGGIIDESALVEGLRSGIVHSAALDVFETEPLPPSSLLREFPRCVFGSHNGSNTEDAVTRTNVRAIELLFDMLDVKEQT